MDPRRLILPLGMLAGLCVVLTFAVVVGRGLAAENTGPVRSPAHPEANTASPRAVLAAWDRRRALAWAEGSPAKLQALYVPGSRAGSADAALLRDYVARGLVVTGLDTQVLGIDVRRQGRDDMDLVVTDRIVGATAVGDGVEQRLPADRPSTRRITMRRVDGEWLVDEVTDQVDATGQDSAEATTSSTSSSSKS